MTDPQATTDSYGRPVEPVRGRRGDILGWKPAGRTGSAMSPTIEGAYPRPPGVAVPCTAAHATFEGRCLNCGGSHARGPAGMSWTCSRCGCPVPLTGRALVDGAALAIHEAADHPPAEPVPSYAALEALSVLLWPADDPGADWSADTIEAVADILARAGYAPASGYQPAGVHRRRAIEQAALRSDE